MYVQRWRLTYSCGPRALIGTHRDQQAAWAAALREAGLAGPDATRPPRFVAAARLPVGMTGDRELADIFLADRRTSLEVRDRLGRALPAGHGLVDLHDVWVGEPALPGRVIAGDYAVRIASEWSQALPALDPRPAVAEFLAATTVDRGRNRVEGSSSANLRPLVVALCQIDLQTLWMRLRLDPALGQPARKKWSRRSHGFWARVLA